MYKLPSNKIKLATVMTFSGMALVIIYMLNNQLKFLLIPALILAVGGLFLYTLWNRCPNCHKGVQATTWPSKNLGKFRCPNCGAQLEYD